MYMCIYVCVHAYMWMLSCFSCVQLFVTLWTIAFKAPLSVGFSRQEYWSALPFPPPGDLPDPGIEPGSLTSPSSAGRLPKRLVCNTVNMIQTEGSGFNRKVLFVVARSTRFIGHSMWKHSNWEKTYKQRVGQRPGFHLIVSLWMHYLTSLVFGVICLVSLWGQRVDVPNDKNP